MQVSMVFVPSASLAPLQSAGLRRPHHLRARRLYRPPKCRCRCGVGHANVVKSCRDVRHFVCLANYYYEFVCVTLSAVTAPGPAHGPLQPQG